MLGKRRNQTAICGGVAALFLAANVGLAASDDTPITREQFLELQRQNQLLQQQVQAQQKVIDSLAHKVSDIQDQQTKNAADASASTATATAKADDLPPPPVSDNSFRLGRVDITGEGGLAFFDPQSQGMTPHPTFRIDEARVFLEAPVWDDVYFYSELDLATRESTSLGLNVGELYLDFEDVSKLWGREQMLNLRVGQFYIPFGEEYQRRFAIDNPLISHSLSDLWGSDAGVELYGKLGLVRYAVAVQDGGITTSQSLQDDKSVAGRLSYDPVKWLHLSASGMRTGNLSVNNGVSAMWFANGFFRSLGSAKTTTFEVNLVEGDVQLSLPYVNLKTAGGYVSYTDDDPVANNHRNVYYYYVEGVHDFNRNFYAAARFSQIFAPNGFPIVAGGTMADYLFGDLTQEYWRLSLGLGYRFSRDLVVKGEYTFNQGVEADGEERNGENLLSLEAAFKF